MREPVCAQGGVELDAFPVLAICLVVCRFPSPFFPPPDILAQCPETIKKTL